MTQVAAERRPVRSFAPWIVGVVGLVLTAYIAAGLAASADWSPTIFVKFSDTPEMAQYADSQFDDVAFSGRLGHDGKFFFVQARDPFYLDPESHAYLLDRPTYRAQRMLYPTIAGGFGALGAEGTAWGLIVVNVLAMGVGTYFTARVATRLGLSPLFGLAFFVNPGVFVSSVIDTAEVVAMVFLMWGLLEIMERRTTNAAVLLSMAALSRETMLLCVVGWIVYEVFWHHKFRWMMLAPFVVSGAWWAYVRWRIGYLSPSLQDVEALGSPLGGLMDALSKWMVDPALKDDLVVGVALVLMLAAFVVWSVTRRSLIPLMGVGFTPVAILMVEEVWFHYFDAARALTPLVTLFFLAVPYAIRPHPEGFA